MVSASSLLIVALCSTLFVACIATPTSRILDGEEASADAFPYVVSVRRDNAHVCGGSIIARNFILTSAQCVSALGSTPIASSRVTIRVGSTNQYAGGKICQVQEIIIHSSYGSFMNDVALLKLELPLDIGARVQIIELAQSVDAVEAGNSVTVPGWGRTISEGPNAYKLQFGDAIALSSADCEDSIGFGYASTLCLKNELGKGACSGDFGGPAVLNDQVVGVASLAIGACGTNYPDVFARVSFYYNWINSIINPE